MGNNKSNNSMGAIKRFVGNKNTVTVLGFIACIATLIIGYNIRVNKSISPISLPYARDTIASRTLITSNMIGKIKIANDYLNEATNVITSSEEVVGKYVSYKTTIPKGSLFYREALVEADAMPDAAFANIEDGQTIYSLAVNSESTYANSIRAGDYIDLYMSARDSLDNNKIIFGCLVRSIRVLAVKDSAGNNILKNSLQYGQPSELLFAVDDDLFELLMESAYVDGDIKITPVIYNSKYTANAGETEVASDYLKQFILSQVMQFE